MINDVNFDRHKLQKLMLDSAEEAMRQHISRDLMAKSKKLAPMDRGDLRASVDFKIDDRKKDERWLIVFFDSRYAAIQHEDVDFKPRGGKRPAPKKHFVHTNGQRKYLETPFKANQSRYIGKIQYQIKKDLKK